MGDELVFITCIFEVLKSTNQVQQSRAWHFSNTMLDH